MLIAVRKYIPYFIIPTSNHSVEQSFVKFSLSSLNFIIGSVYLPPQYSIDSYNIYLFSIETIIHQYLSHYFLFTRKISI